MGIELDYPEFLDDCRSIIGTLLVEHGFQEISASADDYNASYKSQEWIVEIDMLSNFPYIGVGVSFSSITGEGTRPDLLKKALKVGGQEISELYRLYFSQDHYELSSREQFRIELSFNRTILEKLYAPILNGEFKYSDYEAFVKTFSTD